MKHLRRQECLKQRVWSDSNKVENIELFRRHCTATSNQRRVQTDDITSLTYGCLHSDQHGGEDNCSCVWAPTQNNRSLNWALVSLRYHWNRSLSRWSSWRRQWNSPSSVRLRRTSWTQTRWRVVFWRFLGLVQQAQCTLVVSAMIDMERERVEKYRFKNERASPSSFFFHPERQAWQLRQVQMTRIVQNDQATQYKCLKRLHSRLSRLVWTSLYAGNTNRTVTLSGH